MGGRRSRKTQGSIKSNLNRSTSHKAIIRIQHALSLDLLVPPYRAEPSDTEEYFYATRGDCYVATEAAYHLFGKKAGFIPFYCKHPDETTHWWLQHPKPGDIIDPTKPQLEGTTGVYSQGKRGNFLTKKPSRRAAELIRRIKATKK